MTSPPAMLDVRYRYVTVASQMAMAIAQMSSRARNGSGGPHETPTATSIAMKTYGGLQSDSHATAATIAASSPRPGARRLAIARRSSADARNAATIVSASADHEPKRNSAIGSSAAASNSAPNAGAAR